MQLGVVFPQTELGSSSAHELRSYAESVEALGYHHLLAFDHVLGADPAAHPRWRHKYVHRTTFREPLVFFGYLAAVCRLELVTGVLVLPQRQTALVAKQTAEVDLLTEGRFRLGVAVGWNRVEFGALGKEFTDRGRRMEEQIALLRELWVRDSVTVAGQYEQVDGAGIAPLPWQRPIPIWLGAMSAVGYRRIGRLADGWFPHGLTPGDSLAVAQETILNAAAASGRDLDSLGMEPRVTWSGSNADVVDQVGQWCEAGATHISIDTMEAGLGDVERHVGVLADLARQIAVPSGPAVQPA